VVRRPLIRRGSILHRQYDFRATLFFSLGRYLASGSWASGDLVVGDGA
jgi:hypothetical protein